MAYLRHWERLSTGYYFSHHSKVVILGDGRDDGDV